MSRAFVKEDVDPPERSRRARAASGLPPGAANYITERGAQRLRASLADLRRNSDANQAAIAELEQLLASITIVTVPEDRSSIAFGTKVTVRGETGQLRAYNIVGVDELAFYPDAVSWISPIGKTLLAAEVGDRVTLERAARVEVVAVHYPAE